MKKITSDFTKELKKIRIENEVTLVQLSEQLGTTSYTLCSIENEDKEFPLPLLGRYLDYLTLTDEEINFIYRWMIDKRRKELEQFEKDLYNVVYGNKFRGDK